MALPSSFFIVHGASEGRKVRGGSYGGVTTDPLYRSADLDFEPEETIYCSEPSHPSHHQAFFFFFQNLPFHCSHSCPQKRTFPCQDLHQVIQSSLSVAAQPSDKYQIGRVLNTTLTLLKEDPSYSPDFSFSLTTYIPPNECICSLP